MILPGSQSSRLSLHLPDLPEYQVDHLSSVHIPANVDLDSVWLGLLQSVHQVGEELNYFNENYIVDI